jgi:hypothetical protein
VALYERAVDALPERPSLHKPPSDPVFRAALEVYAGELGLGLIP